jgi:HTH-type transcriptional regulator/antitoxin HigA
MKKNTFTPSWENFYIAHEKVEPEKYFQAYLRYSKIYEQLPLSIRKELDDDSNTEISPALLFKNVMDQSYKALFRKTPTANEALSALWMTKVSEVARKKLVYNDYPEFKELTKKDLEEIAKLSIREEIIPELPNILLEFGIVLVYEQGYPSMKVDGVVFKLADKYPVVGLSFRYDRLDYFWFTLLHELSHIVLHWERLETPIFDDLDEESSELIEKEANRLAKASFVKRSVWRNCEPKYQPGDNAVYTFAKKVGIHPAIIAGLLRHERNNYEVYSKIIHHTNVRKLVFENE